MQGAASRLHTRILARIQAAPAVAGATFPGLHFAEPAAQKPRSGICWPAPWFRPPLGQPALVLIRMDWAAGCCLGAYLYGRRTSRQRT